jgi:lysophospholipase L1-like esterase
MWNTRPSSPLIGVLLLASFPAFVHGAPGAKTADLPPNVHRVLFLGDSITYGGQYVSDIEAYFVTRHPDRHIEFLNLGLPSETVSGLSEPGHADGKFPRPDLHERLARVLEKTRPDLVFACYGMNDGIYLPLDEERFAKFREGMQWLRKQVEAAGAKIVIVTPPTYDAVKGHIEFYNSVLDRYSDWLRDQRDHGWDVADLHGPMNRFLAEHRAADPLFYLSGDGIHPNALGHWIMARAILEHLGAGDVSGADDAAGMVSFSAHGTEILRLVEKQQGMMKDAWLTAAGHKRPGMKKGLPLEEALRQSAEMETKIYALANDGAK